jgi:hypothetical protein
VPLAIANILATSKHFSLCSLIVIVSTRAKFLVL